MKLITLLFFSMFSLFAAEQATLRSDLENTYQNWRNAIIAKNVQAWENATSTRQKIDIQNRILSEKRRFPDAIFELPAAPPSTSNLQFLEAIAKGPTATIAFFGPIDFNIGGKPTDNLMVLSFVNEKQKWRFDRANYLNLEALPAVRKELKSGDLSYLKQTPDSQPTGIIPRNPIVVPPAKTIAKVYVFCPGREVIVQLNKVSEHRFSNTKEAETIMGGARNGNNEIQFTIKQLPGSKGNEALTIRVYLMPEKSGFMPYKAYEYLVQEKQPFQNSQTTYFTVNSEMLSKIGN